MAAKSLTERGEYRVVFAPSVAVRDSPWGRKVGTKAQGDVVQTDMRSVGDEGGGWVRLKGGYKGGEGWMLLHGAALGLGTLLEASRPTPAEPGGSSAAPALLFLCTGEGEHSADSDVAYLRASPSWLDVQATIAELTSVSPLETFFDQTLGEHGHQYSPLVTAAISILNADLWRAWGFRPALALGHSIGEVSAAYVAGVLSRDDALRTASQLVSCRLLVPGDTAPPALWWRPRLRPLLRRPRWVPPGPGSPPPAAPLLPGGALLRHRPSSSAAPARSSRAQRV